MVIKFANLKWLITVLVTVLVLSACGSTGEKASTDQKQDSKDKSYTLKLGHLQGSGAVLANIAEAEGFFEKENLKVEYVPFASSIDGLSALQAGKIDVGMTFGTSSPLAFISKGADFKILGGHMSGGHPYLVREEEAKKYKSIKDFSGKTMGTIRLSTPDIVFRAGLKDAGVDVSKEKILEFKGFAPLFQAAESGKIDVIVGGVGHLKEAKAAGFVPVLWSNDINPNHTCCRVVTTGKLSEEKGEAFTALLKGLIQAERIKIDNPEKAVAASREALKLDDEKIAALVNEEHIGNHADPNKKEVVKMWEQMKGLGYLDTSKNVDINTHFNLTFYEQALNELIKENPDDSYYKEQLKKYEANNK